jgi:hypothetical protein
MNSDQSPDLLLRHSTLGVNGVWYLSGSTMTLGSWGANNAFNEFDTNWRIASQDLPDSTWNLDQTPLSSSIVNMAMATVSTSPLQVPLNFQIDSTGISFDLQRRDNGSAWNTIQSDLLPTAAQAPVDGSVQSGHFYEWRLIAYRFGVVTSISRSAFAAVAAPPTLSRGKIIILVDQALRSSSANAQANVDWSVQRLTKDMVGDGWQIVGPHYVTRHNDTGSNSANLTNLLATVRTDYASSPTDIKGVLIVGHVTIPYSGDIASDGHTGSGGADPFNHQGAWPADTMYGCMDTGVWDTLNDDQLTDTQSYFQANWNSQADGKYDLNLIPATLELFVGRIDFANLPSFGTGAGPSDAEASLIKTYVTKADNYRNKVAPFPVEDLGVVHGTFTDYTATESRNATGYRSIKYLFEAAFPTGNISVADPLFRTSANYSGIESSSCLWGFLGGPGMPNCIGNGVPWLQHNTQDFAASVAQPSLEPRVAFYSLFGSYFMDWNLSDDFLRAR